MAGGAGIISFIRFVSRKNAQKAQNKKCFVRFALFGGNY
jgi:hypothetical protein